MYSVSQDGPFGVERGYLITQRSLVGESDCELLADAFWLQESIYSFTVHVRYTVREPPYYERGNDVSCMEIRVDIKMIDVNAGPHTVVCPTEIVILKASRLAVLMELLLLRGFQLKCDPRQSCRTDCFSRSRLLFRPSPCLEAEKNISASCFFVLSEYGR